MARAFASIAACWLVGVTMVNAADLQRWPAGDRAWSDVVSDGRFVYVGAVSPADAQGRVAGTDVRAQTRAVLDGLASRLQLAGSDLSRAASVHVYLRRAADFQAMNEVYASYWTSEPPARTTIVASLIDPDALVEMSAVGLAPGQPRDVVHPADWVKSPNPYSYGIRSGDTLFLSGLVARSGKDNSSIEGDMGRQMQVLLDNGSSILHAAGLSFADVVSSRLFITDVAEFDAMNTAYRPAFPGRPPARATVSCALMAPSYRVELTMVAVSGAPHEAVASTAPDGTVRPSNPNLSPAIVVGNRVFVSGMLGNTPETRDNTRAQTRETLAAIGRVLKSAGTDWSRVTDALVYVTDAANVADVDAVWKDVFGSRGPVRTMIRTRLVASDALVEIMLSAVR